jgi:Mg-chelatase subunit ChlD
MELLSLQPLVWLAAIAVIVAGLRYSLVDQPGWQRLAAFACRAAGIALLVLALCRLYVFTQSEDAHFLFLFDVSESVDLPAARAKVAEIRHAIDSLNAKDSWSLFAVGKFVRQLDSPEQLKELLDNWKSGISDAAMRGESRLADALTEARLTFPAGKARRVILFSDGRSTSGDFAATLRQLSQERIDVQFRPLVPISDAEAGIVSVQPSTKTAFQNEIVRMHVKLSANQAMNAKVRLVHNGVAMQEQSVSLKGEEPLVCHFDAEMATPGPSHWTVELVPDSDHFPLNNQTSCTVDVRGKPRLLVLHQDQRAMRSFARSLNEQGIEVDLRGKLGLPESLNEMLAFDAIVLADIAATDLTLRQMQMLKSYVIDFGGGIVMLGSENSFGLGGYYQTPVEEILPLVSRFEKEKEKPSLAMVLVIDKSGSMEGLPIALARQAAKAAVELLSARDMIGVIGFDGEPQLVCELRSAVEASAVQAAIDSLQAGGGTYMYPAIVQAKEMLETAAAKVRHIIVLSDGHTQPADHHSLAQDAADAGITVSTVALGGADKELLTSIAEIGRGRYYETDDPNNVPQIFTKETMQASKSAIKEDLYGAVQTGDHPMLAGFQEDDLPFSLGYVMTETKPTAQLLLAAETGDPLLAVGRYGLGTGMAFTSDLTERWGAEWLAWEGCGKFWAQALRGVLRRQQAEGLAVHEYADDESWILHVTRTGQDGKPLNAINWDVEVMDGDNRQTPVEVAESGLGQYSMAIPLNDERQLTLRLHDRDFGVLKALHWQRPYPAEYALANTPAQPLVELVRFEPSAIRKGLTPEPQRKPVTHHLYFTSLGLLTAGTLLRRL